ncbi:MAG: hypothetical protein V4702_04500 [Patescibacteria group bacterium]
MPDDDKNTPLTPKSEVITPTNNPDSSVASPPTGQVYSSASQPDPIQSSQTVQSDTPQAETTNNPSSFQSAQTNQTVNNKKKKLLLVSLVGAIIVLLGGGAGAYFGVIVPNKPENVWKKALSNTADGYDKLIEYSQKQKDIKGIKAKGNLKLEGTAAGDGNIEATTFEGNGKYKFDIGFAGSRYELEALTTMPEGAKTPDLYFRVKGLKGIGGLLQASPLAETGAQIENLDSQWIFVDHTLFDQLASTAGGPADAQLTDEDINAIARAIGEVNREYLLSDSPDKRVLTVAEQIGKEDRDGRSTYHYKVGLNKENLKKYLTALKEKLKTTKIKDLASEQQYNDFFDEMVKSIDKEAIDEKDTADVWVDMKTKLIRYVRFTDEKERENYVELGLLYNGGDEYPFVINVNAPKGEEGSGTGSLKTTLNTRANTVKINLLVDVLGEAKEKITGELLFEPNNEPIEVTKPEGAKPIMEVVGAVYGGLLGGMGTDAGANEPSGPFPLEDLEL